MSAHLAQQVKNRSCQRVARFRICAGRINSRITSPAPGPQKNPEQTFFFRKYYEGYLRKKNPEQIDVK